MSSRLIRPVWHTKLPLGILCQVANTRVLRGRSFIMRATSLRVVWLRSPRSVPFGKNWRSSPLVFSFEPRCRGACGSQNQMSIFRRRASKD